MAFAEQQEVVTAFRDVFKRAGKRPFEETAAAFKAVGEAFSTRFAAEGRLWMAAEVRRRAAENILTTAISTRRTPGVCETFLGNVKKLGFTNLTSKVFVVGMFCSYCISRGATRVAERHLVPLMDEIKAAHTRTGDAVWASFLTTCQDVHKSIARKGRSRKPRTSLARTPRTPARKRRSRPGARRSASGARR